MTDTPFINHRLIEKTRALSRSTDSLQIIRDMSPISPYLAPDGCDDESLMGHAVTPDGRAVFKMVGGEEAAKLGLRTLNLTEASAFLDRASRLGELEDAAAQAQAEYIRVWRLFEIAADHLINGTEISKKNMQRIGALLHETRKMNAECAEDERRAREAGNQMHRDRIAGLREAGRKFGLEVRV